MLHRRKLLFILAAAPAALVVRAAHADALEISECLRDATTDADKQECRWKSRKPHER